MRMVPIFRSGTSTNAAPCFARGRRLVHVQRVFPFFEVDDDDDASGCDSLPRTIPAAQHAHAIVQIVVIQRSVGSVVHVEEAPSCPGP